MHRRHRSIVTDTQAIGNGLSILIPGERLSPTGRPSLQRFVTPKHERTGHITENPMRYLTNGRINREDIRDYIASTRKQLVDNLTSLEKGKKIESISMMYEEERRKFDKLKELFEDNMQKFQTNKNDINTLTFVGSEELTTAIEEV